MPEVQEEERGSLGVAEGKVHFGLAVVSPEGAQCLPHSRSSRNIY